MSVTTLVSTQKARAQDKFGSISGQFVLDGEVPKPKLLFKMGDPKIKDGAICAAHDRYSDDLLVDPKTKGIANIFVYIYYRKAKGLTIHPDLKVPKEKEVAFDQKDCRFIPHAMIVRAGQTVILKSGDACAHNTHTTALRNDEFNVIVAPNDRKGIALKNQQRAEPLPLPVKCDIHPWMRAYWLTIDHPYATITDTQGKFKIENLPAGELEFRVWHERVGYIDAGSRRGFKLTVVAGKTTDLDVVKIPLAKFAANP